MTSAAGGRDFTDYARFAPSVNIEPLSGNVSYRGQGVHGISVDGSSGAENVFCVDGVDTTSMYNGLNNQNLRVETVEEFQLKTAGYEAEFGGAMGRRSQRPDPQRLRRISRQPPVVRQRKRADRPAEKAPAARPRSVDRRIRVCARSRRRRPDAGIRLHAGRPHLARPGLVLRRIPVGSPQPEALDHLYLG